jgi:hypothetical protein
MLRSTVTPGWAQGLGLQLVTGYDPLTLAHYQRYFDLLHTGESSAPHYKDNWADLDRIARPDLLDALSVRYVIAPLSLHLKAAPVSTFLAQPVFIFYTGMRTRDLGLYRNPSEQPRARWVDTVVAVSDDDQAAAAVRRVNLRTTAVALGEARHDPPPSPLETVRLDGWVAGALAVSTRSERERFLLVSEVWHPGWAATIDGASAPLLRADLALLGLRVPAGAHHVALLFRPLHWRVALAISAASATLLLGLAALAWRRR